MIEDLNQKYESKEPHRIQPNTNLIQNINAIIRGTISHMQEKIKKPFHVVILNTIKREAINLESFKAPVVNEARSLIEKACEIMEQSKLPDKEIPDICQRLREIALPLDSVDEKMCQERMYQCAINLEPPR